MKRAGENAWSKPAEFAAGGVAQFGTSSGLSAPPQQNARASAGIDHAARKKAKKAKKAVKKQAVGPLKLKLLEQTREGVTLGVSGHARGSGGGMLCWQRDSAVTVVTAADKEQVTFPQLSSGVHVFRVRWAPSPQHEVRPAS